MLERSVRPAALERADERTDGIVLARRVTLEVLADRLADQRRGRATLRSRNAAEASVEPFVEVDLLSKHVSSIHHMPTHIHQPLARLPSKIPRPREVGIISDRGHLEQQFLERLTSRPPQQRLAKDLAMLRLSRAALLLSLIHI